MNKMVLMCKVREQDTEINRLKREQTAEKKFSDGMSELLTRNVDDIPDVGDPIHRLAVEEMTSITADKDRLSKMLGSEYEFYTLILKILTHAILEDPDRPLYWEDESRGSDGSNRCRVTIELPLIMEEVLASLFDVDQSTVSGRINYIKWKISKVLPIGKELVKKIQKLPARVHDMLIPGRILLTDGTVMETMRPSDPVMREITYTGKKKMHENNTLVVVSTSGITLGISMSVGARMVDAGLIQKYLPELRTMFPSIFDPKTPKSRRYEIFLDKGFGGSEKHFPGATVRIPKKRSKYHELTADEERGNLAVSKIRIKVEHRIGRLKRYQSISGKFRGTANEFNKNIRLVAGIENLRVMWKLGLESYFFPAAMVA